MFELVNTNVPAPIIFNEPLPPINLVIVKVPAGLKLFMPINDKLPPLNVWLPVDVKNASVKIMVFVILLPMVPAKFKVAFLLTAMVLPPIAVALLAIDMMPSLMFVVPVYVFALLNTNSPIPILLIVAANALLITPDMVKVLAVEPLTLMVLAPVSATLPLKVLSPLMFASKIVPLASKVMLFGMTNPLPEIFKVVDALTTMVLVPKPLLLATVMKPVLMLVVPV